MSAAAAPGSRPFTGVTSEQNQTDIEIVDRLASAHCNHEAACGHIGAGKKYATRDVCQDELRGQNAPDLTAYACPRGIAQPRLDACFQQLREEPCSFSLTHWITHLFSTNSCAASALCIK